MQNSLLTRSVAVAAVAGIGLTLTATAAQAAEPVAPSFDLAVPTTLITGAAATGFVGHLAAPDGAQDIWVRTSITGSAADAVTLEWKNADGVWETMPDKDLVAEGLQVGFADGDADGNGVKGFSVPAGIGYAADSEFRIAVADGAAAGTLSWVSELVSGDAATVVDTTSGTVEVDRPVAPKAGLAARADAVVYGKDVRFTGTLLDANHDDAPLAGQAVTVFRQVADQAPVAFATTTTDANGAFEVSVPAEESATYWATAGEQTTEKVEVTVAKRLSSVFVNRKHATVRQVVRFTGHVVSPERNQVVELQKQRKNGSWKTVATADANRSGAFKVGGTLARGTKTYRVVAPGSELVTGATSKGFLITVR